MSRVIRLTIIALVILVMLLPAGCKSSPPPTSGKLTLNDSVTILDLTQDLPSRFTKYDPKQERLSNSDLQLGKEFSEVQLYIAQQPYQLIFTFYGIVDDPQKKAELEKAFGDEQEFKNMIINDFLSGITLGAAPQFEIKISHPDIGEKANLSSGLIAINSMQLGYDILFFRIKNVYVFLASLDNSKKEGVVDITPLGQTIAGRINPYLQ